MRTPLATVANAARTGTPASWAGWQWRQAIDFQRRGIEVFVIWEAAAAMLIGASLMMRVDEGPRLFGVPGVALFFFTLAVLAGIALTAWIVSTDRKVARSGHVGR